MTVTLGGAGQSHNSDSDYLNKNRGVIMANEQNLRPQSMRTKSEQREIARKGGIASGESRREKKFLSQAYADILSEKEGFVSGLPLKDVVKKIIARGNSSSVSMLKEIRESTEGQKIIHGNDSDNPVEMQINVIGIQPKE